MSSQAKLLSRVREVRREMESQVRPETYRKLLTVIRETMDYAYEEGLTHGRIGVCPKCWWWRFWRTR
jgi:hypothetical protein